MFSEERGCLGCRFSKCTAYSTICLKDHYGVTVGDGCEDRQPREKWVDDTNLDTM